MTDATDTIDAEITANGLQFHYREWGDPNAPPVLILHGITGHSWEWDTVARALSSDFHVIALDQRGHGASDWTDSYAPEAMADDIGAVLAELGIGRVKLVGHSMGAINSYLFAGRNPRAVERLVIADVSPDSLTEDAEEMLRTALSAWAAASFTTPDDAFAEWRENSPLATDHGLRLYVNHNLTRRGDGRFVWRFDAARLSGFIDALPPAEEQWQAIRNVDCPVLVLRGGESDLFSHEAAGRLSQRLLYATLAEIPHAGHDIHIDRPDLTIQAIRGFLTGA